MLCCEYYAREVIINRTLGCECCQMCFPRRQLVKYIPPENIGFIISLYAVDKPLEVPLQHFVVRIEEHHIGGPGQLQSSVAGNRGALAAL